MLCYVNYMKGFDSGLRSIRFRALWAFGVSGFLAFEVSYRKIPKAEKYLIIVAFGPLY